jgi:hypothetical protein
VCYLGKFQSKITAIIEEVLSSKLEVNKKFDWLINSHLEVKNPDDYKLLENIFFSLNGDFEGLSKKRTKRLENDAFYEKGNLLIEIDEIQHFTIYRLKSLELIKNHNIELGYSIEDYTNICSNHYTSAIRKGPSGYRSPKRDFPFENGRACQRAYLDSLRDVLSIRHLKIPVLRISEIELSQYNSDEKIKVYLQKKLEKYFYSAPLI